MSRIYRIDSDNINKLRELLRDEIEKNAVPYGDSGEEFSDNQLKMALERALDHYNNVRPKTGYTTILPQIEQMVLWLGIVYALKLASIFHARDAMPYGSNLQINDSESKPGQYSAIAGQMLQELEHEIMEHKRAIDSMNFGIITRTGVDGSEINPHMADDNGIIAP